MERILVLEPVMRTFLKVLLFAVVGLVVVVPVMMLLGVVGIPLLGVVVGVVGAGFGLLFALLKIGLVIILPIVVVVWLLKLLFARG
jgi:hypothetical protein